MVKRAQAGYFGLCSFLDDNVGKVLAALHQSGLGGNTRVVYTSDHGDNLGARGLWGKSTMYEESVGVPLIAAGPGFAAGQRITTPANLLDIYPLIMESAGAVSPETVTTAHPGISIARLAAGEDAGRVTFSEYHAMGSKTAAYMVRKGPWKLVHYADYPPQLFDLASDPEELNDLAGDANAKPVLEEMTAALKTICDPAEVSRRAKADQQALLEKVGGKEFVIERGDLGFSPPPGVAPQFN
jgi:choline-sulfatase